MVYVKLKNGRVDRVDNLSAHTLVEQGAKMVQKKDFDSYQNKSMTANVRVDNKKKPYKKRKYYATK